MKAKSGITTPYYRFAVTASADSQQHRMLLNLDISPNEVFYAAPMFYTKPAFDHAYINNEVRHRSFFVRPRVIGPFSDSKAHHVSFDGRKCVVMSEFREIKALGIGDLERHFRERLAEDKVPIGQALPAIVERARGAREVVRRQEAEAVEASGRDTELAARPARRDTPSVPDGRETRAMEEIVGGSVPGEAERIDAAQEFIDAQRAAIPPVPAPPPAAKGDGDDGRRGLLAELADISIRDFSAQLYIVQDRGDAGS